MPSSRLLCALLGTLVAASAAEARVTRFVVEERIAFAPGTEWGSAGPYERLKGTAYMEVDPADPLNAVIFNLDRAPKNARGRVEFSSPFLILKPTDMARGNQKIWYGMNNRGNCIELSFRSQPFRGSDCNPTTAAQVGEDNPVLTEGFTFVDAGWHGDGPPDPNRARLFPTFPVAVQANGDPITGPLRLEYQPNAATFSMSIVSGGWRPYETASTSTSSATFTVRDRQDAPRTVIPSNRWAFGTCPTGAASLAPTTTDICLFDGFQPLKIYELIYTAKNPIVMGLAYAVTRDIGSFLRYQAQDDVGNPNPLAVAGQLNIRRAYSSGTSSTGMYQRDFLYLGFNEDESHRRVFDAATILSAATHRLFANVQFAHPTFYSRQDANQDYTSNALPPFTFAVTTDPLTGITDGILKRPATDPLVMQIDEELVFWQWKASLNVHDGLGNPVAVPDNVRLYFQTGYGHISGAGLLAPPGPLGNCQDPTTGVGNGQAGAGVTPRALVRVIDDWADRGIAPPPSNYPRLEDGTLVSLDDYRAAFPAVPGVERPSVVNTIDVLDFGPSFNRMGGIQTTLPPVHGARYRVFVPKANVDGNGIAGIQTIWTRVPLGSVTGWNIYAAARAPDLCGLNGGYLPFASTLLQRGLDPRLSVQERYVDHDGFVNAVRQGAKELVRNRFLMKIDADKLINGAAASDVLR